MNLIRTLVRKQRETIAALGGERGGLLVETATALAIFGILGVGVLSAVQTSSGSKRNFDLDSQAENIVRNQLDSAFDQAYKAPDDADPTYNPVTTTAGYTVTAESLYHYSTSTDISIVRITVKQGGQTIKVYETLRSNW